MERLMSAAAATAGAAAIGGTAGAGIRTTDALLAALFGFHDVADGAAENGDQRNNDNDIFHRLIYR